MRIAVFTNQFPGQVSTFFARDMRGLIEAGMEIEVFPLYPLDPRLWRYVPDLLNERVLPRKHVHHLTPAQCLRAAKRLSPRKAARFLRDVLAISSSAARFGLSPFAKTSYTFLKAWTWAQEYPNNYDHVLAYWGNYPATCAYLYHRLCGSKNPFALFLHANVDLYRNPIYMKPKLQYADKIITCSVFNRGFIFRSFPALEHLIRNKLFVHYHGLDLREYSMQLDSRSPGKVIGVGRFVKQKGFDYLLRAIRLLKDRGIQIELELVGDGKEAPRLRTLACELDLTEAVRFRGWLVADEVAAAIRQAMILVHPSPDIGDGVPNVIKEAMAVGTPVIGSNVAGIPELLGNGERGILVRPKDVHALATAIEALLTDCELRERYAQRARKHAEESFDLWKNGEQLAKCLLSTRRPLIGPQSAN